MQFGGSGTHPNTTSGLTVYFRDCVFTWYITSGIAVSSISTDNSTEPTLSLNDCSELATVTSALCAEGCQPLPQDYHNYWKVSYHSNSPNAEITGMATACCPACPNTQVVAKPLFKWNVLILPLESGTDRK